jgi:hypothetical protein
MGLRFFCGIFPGGEGCYGDLSNGGVGLSPRLVFIIIWSKLE